VSLISNLNHCKSDDLLADFEALLEDLCDGVFTQFFRIDVHHGVMQVGVEFIAHISENFHAREVNIFTSSFMVISTPFL